MSEVAEYRAQLIARLQNEMNTVPKPLLGGLFRAVEIVTEDLPAGAPEPLVASASAWEAGDPCGNCGSTDTAWHADGLLVQAHCNGCGADDWDDD